MTTRSSLGSFIDQRGSLLILTWYFILWSNWVFFDVVPHTLAALIPWVWVPHRVLWSKVISNAVCVFLNAGWLAGQLCCECNKLTSPQLPTSIYASQEFPRQRSHKVEKSTLYCEVLISDNNVLFPRIERITTREAWWLAEAKKRLMDLIGKNNAP